MFIILEAELSSGTSTANFIVTFVSPTAMDTEQDALLQQVKTLQEQIALLQAQQQSVPSDTASATGNTLKPDDTSTAMDDSELLNLALDWGDFDPAVIQSLKNNPALRKNFIQIHTLQADATKVIQETAMVQREPKRPREEAAASSLVQPLEVSTLTDSDIKVMFEQYTTSYLVPQLNGLQQTLEKAANHVLENMDKLQARALVQQFTQQQQIATLEKKQSRKTLILKLVHRQAPYSISDIKSNLSRLCYLAGVQEEFIEDKVHHYVPTLGTYLFLVLLTETAKALVLQTLKKSFWWKTPGQDDFRVKFEEHVTATDRMLTQPFYALLDYINAAPNIQQANIRADKRFLQVIEDNDGNRKLLAQLCFLPYSSGYRAMVLLHSDYQQHLDQLPALLQARLATATQIIQAEKIAFASGNTREVAVWQAQIDPIVFSPAAHYPMELVFQQFTDDLSVALLEDPHLLLRGRPSVLNITALAHFRAPSQPADTSYAGRALPPHVQKQISSNSPKGTSKGKNSKGKANKPYYTPSQEWHSNSWRKDDRDDGNDDQWQQGNWKGQSSNATWKSGQQGSRPGNTSNQGNTSNWNQNQRRWHSSPQDSTSTSTTSTSKNSKSILLKGFTILFALCQKCSSPLGTGHCTDCTDHAYFQCPSCDCSLGVSPKCEFCKEHKSWLVSKINGKTWFQATSPFELVLDYTINKVLFHDPPFAGPNVRLALQALSSSRSHPDLTARYDSGFLDLFSDVLQADPASVLRLCPNWDWKNVKMSTLQSKGDTNFNYDIGDYIYTPITAKLFQQLFESMIPLLQSDSNQPLVIQKALLPHHMHTGMLPYAKMVQHSWNRLTSSNDDFSEYELSKAFQWWYQDSPRDMVHWSSTFADWIRNSQVAEDIFMGNSPYTEKPLKFVANIGSQFFDILSAIFAAIYKLGPIQKTQNEAQPNNALEDMYNSLVKLEGLSNDSNFVRSTNNKGNSMEALALYMFEDSQFALIWYTAYISFHHTYADYNHPMLRQV